MQVYILYSKRNDIYESVVFVSDLWSRRASMRRYQHLYDAKTAPQQPNAPWQKQEQDNFPEDIMSTYPTVDVMSPYPGGDVVSSGDFNSDNDRTRTFHPGEADIEVSHEYPGHTHLVSPSEDTITDRATDLMPEYVNVGSVSRSDGHINLIPHKHFSHEHTNVSSSSHRQSNISHGLTNLSSRGQIPLTSYSHGHLNVVLHSKDNSDTDDVFYKEEEHGQVAAFTNITAEQQTSLHPLSKVSLHITFT